MQPIIRRCKEVIQNHYGDRCAGLILYGSMARGTGEAVSDIDLLVLLQGPFDYFREIRTLTDLLYPLQLESANLISAKPASAEEFEFGSLQLYRNAKREGISL